MKTLTPNSVDYFRIRYLAQTLALANAKVQLAQVARDNAALAYRAACQNVGMEPDVAYRFDDQHCTLTEVDDGESDSSGNG